MTEKNPWDVPAKNINPFDAPPPPYTSKSSYTVDPTPAFSTSTMRTSSNEPEWSQRTSPNESDWSKRTPHTSQTYGTRETEWTKQNQEVENYPQATPVVDPSTSLTQNEEFLDDKKHHHGMHFGKSLPFFIFLLLSSIAAAAVFAFSAMQYKDVTSTKAGSFISGGSCKNVLHQPLRFRFESDPNYLFCGWTTKNEAIRICVSLASFFGTIIAIIALRRSWKALIWLYALICLVFGGLYFWVMALDASAIRTSSTWCSDGLPGMNYQNGKIVCSFTPFAITALLDAVGFICQILVVIFGIRHARRIM